MRTALLAMLSLFLSLSSCQRGRQLKPRSGGEPFEVVVMAADEEFGSAIDSVLEQPMAALPQEEPLFSVSRSQATELTQATRYARTIVKIERDTTLSRTTIRYSRDRYAAPQLIATIATPNVAALRGAGKRLVALLEGFELNALAASLDGHRNSEAEKRLADTFGLSMKVPQELNTSKWGRDFAWLSDNGKLSMGNICLYSYPGRAFDAATFVDRRDSVMAHNIPGETPAMRMATERRQPLSVAREGRATVVRGLWQMENDAMGGPFVALARVDSQRGRVVVAEAFVYAPGRKKRAKLRRLEAAARTMNTDKTNTYDNGKRQ